MNRINYSQWTFTDKDIVSGSVAMSNALMFDSLNPDELTVEVVSGDTGKRKVMVQPETTPNPLEWYTTNDNRGYVVMTGDIRQFTYGTPLWYYYNNILQGKFYIRSVDRLSIDHFRLNAFSVVGMWTNIQHLGGVYNGELTRNVVADLLSGFTYTIDSDVGAVPLYGYLPIASVRDNLQQVLFAIGASVMKDDSGNPRIQFLKDRSQIAIGSNRIFIGGTLTYKTPSTSIQVTEHSYYKSAYDSEVSLFDNTDGSGTAQDKLITFEDPCHDLKWNGSPISSTWDSGPNYCYVTGTGVLTGEKYTHTTRVFSVATGASGEQKEAKIENATLVSPVNSANVAARVSDYQATTEEVACGIVLGSDNIKPGKIVSFADPYGEDTSGFIAQMSITMSMQSKADCTIVKGYEPSHFGNNFTRVAVITSNQSWQVPQGTSIVRLVLGQGGQAGQSGFDGEDAYHPTFSFDPPASGGAGGAGGRGGNGGKVAVIDVIAPTGPITFSIGAGGDPIEGSGEEGFDGGHTTATVDGMTYSSASGAIPPEGYRDVINGKMYSESGFPGFSGCNGGTNSAGQDFPYNRTWTGGAMGRDYESDGDKVRYANGGSGGGAAYGGSGGNGGDYYWSGSGSTSYRRGGDGGDGADAWTMALLPSLGGGGTGGCGGGGGGLGGYYYWENASSTNPDYDAEGYGRDGHGGSGSLGGTGGSGYALIYY